LDQHERVPKVHPKGKIPLGRILRPPEPDGTSASVYRVVESRFCLCIPEGGIWKSAKDGLQDAVDGIFGDDEEVAE
jgi:hypothetical protein